MMFAWEDGGIASLSARTSPCRACGTKEWSMMAERMTGRFTELERGGADEHQGEVSSEAVTGRTDPFVAQLSDVADSDRAAQANLCSASRGRRDAPAGTGPRCGLQQSGERSGLPTDVDLRRLGFACRGITLGDVEPLIDGHVPPTHRRGVPATSYDLGFGSRQSHIGNRTRPSSAAAISGSKAIPSRQVWSLGLRFSALEGVRQYLRNGYQSWDGSFFVEARHSGGEGPGGQGSDTWLRNDCVVARNGSRRARARLHSSRSLPGRLRFWRRRRARHSRCKRSGMAFRTTAQWLPSP